RKRPVMALEIGRDVCTVAVELVFGLFHDLRAGSPRAGAVLVDAALDADVNALRVLPAQRGGAASPVRPLGPEHDDAITTRHFGMDNIALGVGEDHARLETEGILKPLERGAIVFIGERRNEPGVAGGGCGHGELRKYYHFV